MSIFCRLFGHSWSVAFPNKETIKHSEIITSCRICGISPSSCLIAVD